MGYKEVPRFRTEASHVLTLGSGSVLRAYGRESSSLINVDTIQIK